MTFNKISRLPAIGDLAGVYFVYNTDNPIINGIYVKSRRPSPLVIATRDTIIDNTFPAAKPRNNPPKPPAIPRIIASARKRSRTSFDTIPIVFIPPISRVRSSNETVRE